MDGCVCVYVSKCLRACMNCTTTKCAKETVAASVAVVRINSRYLNDNVTCDGSKDSSKKR